MLKIIKLNENPLKSIESCVLAIKQIPSAMPGGPLTEVASHF